MAYVYLRGLCPVNVRFKEDRNKAMKTTREGPTKIGVKTIERVWRKRAKDARHIVTDSERPGLALIVNSTSMAWAYSYKPRGVDPVSGKRFNTQTVTMGSPETYSPDQARAEANRIRDAVAAGGDPGADRKAAIAEMTLQRASTVERAAADYLALLPMKEKKGGGLISRAWVEEQADHLSRAVATLGIASSPLTGVDVRTVRKLQQGEAYRHRFGALNRFLDWAVHEDRISANPCASIGRAYRPVAGGERERTPSLRDLALIWTACEKALELVFCDFVRFAITTPARRNEIANLRWGHLDLDARVWDQPGRLTKNRNAHQLRLNAPGLQILRRRWDAAGRPAAGLVFPSPRSMKPISAFSAMLRALHREAPDVASWSLHDLRRSFATALGKLGEDSESTIDAVLNHRQAGSRAGVLGTYNRSTRLPAQAEALERWGRLIKDALEGRFPEEAEVIPLARRAQP
jgi:integrase